ncbi:hypothetical protein PbJCM13498_11940 [Prolixibacter bellariivorans]|uniref:DUF1735 domain-containing protein n=1 Tax=Prolixibacter bellariivorans TaxID=314319 RepID=A0A5M4AXI1_9BACT|nr:hypothetical protein [Prolixibacter bellariivorans]GET32331.1 hypothetical protein PbJCM13498_11940 [Prolixibacter bellariivorans]
MKTINIFKAVAILFFTFAALSCNDLFNWGTRDYSTQLEIGVAKGGSVLKAAVDEPYYLDNCELATADAIRISIATQGGDPVVNMQDKILLLHSVGDGVASDLIMLLPGTYVVTKFEVLQLVDDGGGVTHYETIMATPVEGSVFSGYVNTPLNYEFEVELYQKKRLLMEVLCFEPTDVASFGFVWTGVNVILGDEICLYVSQCTSNGTETWGPADYSATFYTMIDESTVGDIYASSGNSSDGWICFPLWSGATDYGVGVQIVYDGDVEADFIITAAEVNQILLELQNDPVNAGEGYYVYEILCPVP